MTTFCAGHHFVLRFLSFVFLISIVQLLSVGSMMMLGTGFKRTFPWTTTITSPTSLQFAVRQVGRIKKPISFRRLSPDTKLAMAVGGFGFKKATTTLQVLKYPDPKLRTTNEVITLFDDSLKKMADDMLEVMYQDEGVGLAAPQVGYNKRMMVFNEVGDQEKKSFERVLINPRIISFSNDTAVEEEGCLSFPNIHGSVKRSIAIEVEYQDLKGIVSTMTLKDFPARIFQHEYDHLDRVLFIDRLEEKDRIANQKKIDKMVKKFGPGGAI